MPLEMGTETSLSLSLTKNVVSFDFGHDVYMACVCNVCSILIFIGQKTRPQFLPRSNKLDSPGKPDKLDKPDKPDKIDQPDKPDKLYKPDKLGKVD